MIIAELRQKYNFNELLKFAEIPRSSYYYLIKKSKSIDKYNDVKCEIKDIFHSNKGRYGYRRVHLELINRGFRINHKTVYRLMKVLNLKCLVRIKKYKSYKGEVGKVAPNLINRNFNVDFPNRKWVTDITEFNVSGKKLYLSPILDLYNGEIISYKLSIRPNFAQVREMLSLAFEKFGTLDGLILHSDQGWQYQMKPYQDMLKSKGIIQSMSRKGNCLDNSVIENFFGILKSELYYLEKFKSIDELKLAIEQYIHYYNNQRIKSKLKGQSPISFRTSSLFSA